MAIELVISWNNISGVNDLSTAAQLIPLVISGVYVLRSVLAWLSEPFVQDSDSLESPYLPDESFFNWTGGGGGGAGGDDGGSVQPPRNLMYIGSSWDWAGQQAPSHHHGRSRRHHHRGHARDGSYVVDPSYGAYDAMGHMGDVHPQMSAAGVPQEPAPAATAHSRRATVMDEADEIYAADDGHAA